MAGSPGVIESNPRFGPLAFKALADFYGGAGVPVKTIISDKEYTKDNAAASCRTPTDPTSVRAPAVVMDRRPSTGQAASGFQCGRRATHATEAGCS